MNELLTLFSVVFVVVYCDSNVRKLLMDEGKLMIRIPPIYEGDTLHVKLEHATCVDWMMLPDVNNGIPIKVASGCKKMDECSYVRSGYRIVTKYSYSYLGKNATTYEDIGILKCIGSVNKSFAIKVIPREKFDVKLHVGEKSNNIIIKCFEKPSTDRISWKIWENTGDIAQCTPVRCSFIGNVLMITSIDDHSYGRYICSDGTVSNRYTVIPPPYDCVTDVDSGVSSNKKKLIGGEDGEEDEDVYNFVNMIILIVFTLSFVVGIVTTIICCKK